MGFFQNFVSFFRDQPEQRETLIDTSTTASGTVLSSIISEKPMTPLKALEIPAVKASLNLIKATVRETPLKLYKKVDGKVVEVTDDYRLFLLNEETGDTLNASQFWDAMIEDYFLNGSSIAFINRKGNKAKSIHYVDYRDYTTIDNNNPIFKDYAVLIRGNIYQPYDFIKLVRDSKDGCSGIGIVQQNQLLLRTMYNSMEYENNLVETGGNKKGFLKSSKKLAAEALTKLKEAFKNLYTTNSENVVVLNDGLEFQESSNTSVEMELGSNKDRNSAEIAKLFNIPLGMLSGTGTTGASEDDKKKFLDFCILPLLCTIANALNRDLLMESEKGRYFFRFDTKDIQKGSLQERMSAYDIAIKNNVMTVNECRQIENLDPIDEYNFINLSLGSVLYNTETGNAFVPNTGTTFNLKDGYTNGGQTDADTDSSTE